MTPHAFYIPEKRRRHIKSLSLLRQNAAPAHILPGRSLQVYPHRVPSSSVQPPNQRGKVTSIQPSDGFVPDVIYTCSDSREKVSTRSTGIDVKILFDRGFSTMPTASGTRSNTDLTPRVQDFVRDVFQQFEHLMDVLRNNTIPFNIAMILQIAYRAVQIFVKRERNNQSRLSRRLRQKPPLGSAIEEKEEAALEAQH